MRTFQRKRDEDRAPRRGWSRLKLRSQGQQERESQREGWGAWWPAPHLQLLGVADAVVQDVDLAEHQRTRWQSWREAPLPRPNPSRAPLSPSPSPAWPPANTGLTSYFCCFSFAIRSNFSDSSWWIQSD